MQDNDSNLKKLEKLAKEKNLEFYKISSVTGQGVQELIDHVSLELKNMPKEELFEIKDEKVYTLPEDKKDEWTARKVGNLFIVEGRAVDRLMGRINIEDNESMYYLEKELKRLGIEEKLKALGVKPGDTVKISDWEMEWYV